MILTGSNCCPADSNELLELLLCRKLEAGGVSWITSLLNPHTLAALLLHLISHLQGPSNSGNLTPKLVTHMRILLRPCCQGNILTS